MKRSLAGGLLLVLSILTAPVFAQGLGPPPSMISAKVIEGGDLEVQYVVLKPVQKVEARKEPVTEIREEIVGGVTRKIAVVVEREVAVTVTTYVAETRGSRISKNSFHVLDLKGNKVEGDALAKAFEKPRSALLVSQAKELESFYADFFKPDTLVIYQKGGPPTGVAPPLDVPAPAPRPISAPKP